MVESLPHGSLTELPRRPCYYGCIQCFQDLRQGLHHLLGSLAVAGSSPNADDTLIALHLHERDVLQELGRGLHKLQNKMSEWLLLHARRKISYHTCIAMTSHHAEPSRKISYHT